MMATSALNQLTGMPNLPITRGVVGGMTAAPKGYIGAKEIMPAQEELSGAISAAEEKVVQADIGIEKAKREEKTRELEAKGESLAQYVKDVEAMPERAALKESREALKGMEFVPTRDTVNDIAGLFSLIGVIGMVTGKGNAMQAMNAMNGMLEGHKKGRADLFKQEQVTFDKNFKAMQMKVQQALAEYQEALELKKTDREAGEIAKQVALARMESPLLKEMESKLGEVRVLNNLKDTKKAMDEAVKLQNDLQAKAEDRLFKEKQLASQERLRLSQMDLQRELAMARLGKKEKAPADVEKSVRQNAVFLENMEDIVDKADKLIKGGNIRGIGVVQGKIPYDVAQLYMTKEERDFLQDFNALTNQKLKDQSGATVTGAEFARQRGVLPLRDDQPQVVLDKLNNWKRLVAQETSVYGRAYPDVIRRYGIALDLPSDKSKLVTGLEYRTPKGVMLWDGEQFLAPSGE